MFKNKSLWIGFALIFVLLLILVLDVFKDEVEAPDSSSAGTVAQSDETPEPVELSNAIFYEDVTYVDVDPNTRHQMDVYVPSEFEGRRPLLIWIHGGGWIEGDKAEPPILEMLDEGFVVASINYRLSPTYLHPSQVHDVKAAIRYLKAHGSDFRIDNQHIALIGHSAGAHLAAFAGLSDGEEFAEDLEQGHAGASSNVQAVVSSAPPIDFRSIVTQAETIGLTELETIPGAPNSIEDVTPEILLTGCTIAVCPEQVDQTNPILSISADDPPVFIQHSRDDDVVPYLQGEQLHKAMLAVGLDSTFNLLEDAAHEFVFTAEMKNWILEKLEQNG